MCACMQVEFNKAAQSLTDAMVPTAQKKIALSRLVKVAYFKFQQILKLTFTFERKMIVSPLVCLLLT